VLPETPEPPPVKPPKKDVKPADITLEETPEAPHKKKKARPKKHPKAETEPPPEKEPEVAPVPTHEQATKPASAKKSGEGEGEESKDGKSKKDDGEGLLGPFRIGIILGTGLPSILSFGGMIKLTRYFGAGVNIGLIPSIRLAYYGEAELSYQEYDIYGRIFPFGGAFFAGAGVGYAHAGGSFASPPFDTSTYQNQVPAGFTLPNPLFVTNEASVRVMVLTPTIGLLHTFGSGFTIGIDAGAQIPIAPSETTFTTKLPPTVPKPVIDTFIEPNNQKVRETLDTMSRSIIPTLNLRIGWLI
jgi:hypothetical protein